MVTYNSTSSGDIPNAVLSFVGDGPAWGPSDSMPATLLIFSLSLNGPVSFELLSTSSSWAFVVCTVAGQEVGHSRQWATGFNTLDSVHMVLLGD